MVLASCTAVAASMFSPCTASQWARQRPLASWMHQLLRVGDQWYPRSWTFLLSISNQIRSGATENGLSSTESWYFEMGLPDFHSLHCESSSDVSSCTNSAEVM